ncbi:MAG: hypothetical protein SFT92_08890 [Rickettsiales bacterium]|nr:hypothetical protein [Rickettsiales bacterium]
MLRIWCLGLSDPQWPERMRALCDAIGAEVVYWTAMQNCEQTVQQHFPQVMFQVMADAILGKAVPVRDEPYVPCDQKLLDAMQPYQLTALKLMDRMDPTGRSFSFNARLRHYYRQLEQWYNLLLQSMPDVVFFPITPHANYDYIVYRLCQYLGIQTVLLERTAIPSRTLVGGSIAEPSAALAVQYQVIRNAQQGAVSLPEPLEQYLQRVQGSYEQGMPLNVQKKIARTRHNSYSSQGAGLWFILRYELSKYRSYLRKGAKLLRDNYWVSARYDPEEMRFSYALEMVQRLLAGLHKYELKIAYNEYQTQELPDEPYVFVALHYQPERNSLPISDWYADQYLMIDLLSKELPKGWKLYVKEHTQQWSYFAKGERARSVSFYKDLLELDNVRLVPTDMTSFDLIDKAVATATIAGSAGWESLVRGKPALVFGEAWYQGVEGCYRVKTRADLRGALQAIQEKPGVDKDQIRLFLKALDECSLHCVIDSVREDHGEVEPGVMLDHFVQTVGRFIRGKQAA